MFKYLHQICCLIFLFLHFAMTVHQQSRKWSLNIFVSKLLQNCSSIINTNCLFIKMTLNKRFSYLFEWYYLPNWFWYFTALFIRATLISGHLTQNDWTVINWCHATKFWYLEGICRIIYLCWQVIVRYDISFYLWFLMYFLLLYMV